MDAVSIFLIGFLGVSIAWSVWYEYRDSGKKEKKR